MPILPGSHDHTTLKWTSREMRACMIIKRQKFTTSLLCPNQGTDRQKKVLSSRHLRIDRNCKSETPVYMILLHAHVLAYCHIALLIVKFATTFANGGKITQTPSKMILLPQRARSCQLSHCIVNSEICNNICKWWKNNANSK